MTNPVRRDQRATPVKIGRPATGNTGKSVKLYITTAVLQSAKRFAYGRNDSLSCYVEQLIEADMAKAAKRKGAA